MLRTDTNDTRTWKALCGTFLIGTLVAIFHDHLAAVIPNIFRALLAWLVLLGGATPAGSPSPTPAPAPVEQLAPAGVVTPAPLPIHISVSVSAPATLPAPESVLKPLEPIIELPRGALRPTATLQTAFAIHYSDTGWGLPGACQLRVEQDGNARFITFTHWRWEFRSFDGTVIVAHNAPLPAPIKVGASGAVTSFQVIDPEIIQQFNAHHLGNHAHEKQVATLKLTLTGVDDQGQIIEAIHQL